MIPFFPFFPQGWRTGCRQFVDLISKGLVRQRWHNLVMSLVFFSSQICLKYGKFSLKRLVKSLLTTDHGTLACVASHNACLYVAAVKVSSAWKDLLMLCLVMFLVFLCSVHLTTHQHVNTARSYLHLPYLELKFSTWPGRISAFRTVRLMFNRPRLAVFIYSHDSEQCWSLSVNLSLSCFFFFFQWSGRIQTSH